MILVKTERPSEELEVGSLCRKSWSFWLLVCMLGLTFFLPAIENRSEAEDAFWYSKEVEELGFRQLIHPNHWLYHPVAKFFYLLSGQERSFDALLFLSGLMGLVALILFYRILKFVIRLDSWSALAMTCCLAFSYGFWRYTREVEVYAMGWAVTLVSLSFLFSRSTGWRVVFFALAAVLAFNVHRALGVPLLAAGGSYFLFSKRPKALGSCLLYLFVFGLLFEKSMPLVFSEKTDSRRDLAGYSVGHNAEALSEGRKEGKRFRASSIPKAAVGLGVALVGGNIVMSSDTVFETLKKRFFKYRFLKEERMMVEGVSPAWLVIWLIALIAFSVLLVFGIFLQFERNGFEFSAEVFAIAVGAIAYAGIIVFFEPGNPEMWLFILPFLWLLVAYFSRLCRLTWRWGLFGCVFLCSSVGGMAWLGETSRDYHFVTSKLVREQAVAGDIYLVGLPSAVHLRYVRYRTPVTPIIFDSSILAQSASEWSEVYLALQDGRRVFAHETFFSSDEGERILPEQISRFSSGENLRFEGSEIGFREPD